MSEQTIWQELKSYGFNDFAVAGIMGNMEAESALISNNVENRCPTSDADYTSNVDNGRYTRDQFIHDAYGYGLCQWTYFSRKAGLYDLCQQYNVSISDEETQLQFLLRELKNEYTSCYNKLLNAKSVAEASNAFLLEFERPANMYAQQNYRAGLGQKYYDKYKGTGDGLYNPSVNAQPATQAAATSSAKCAVFLPILKQGDEGIAVVMAQRALLCFCPELGVSLGETGPNKDGVDGVFGGKMAEVVKAFQKAKSLAQTGTVEKTTWEAISK